MAVRPLPKPFLPRGLTSGEQAAVYIRQLIFEGHLRAGERVHQDEVATALGLSRIPVREALVALEQQGWVSIEPNRGAFVTTLDEQGVRDHYDLLALVYGFAVTRAIDNDDGTLGGMLTQQAADFATAKTPDEARLYMLVFHLTLMQAVPRVAVVVRALSSVVPGQFFESVPRGFELSATGIRDVARAAVEHDAARARAALQTLMASLADEVLPLFRARGLVV